MRNKLRAAWATLKKTVQQNRLLLRIFLMVMGIVSVIMSIMTIVLCGNSSSVINREFNLTNYATVQKVQTITDSIFKETQRMAARLMMDNDIQQYLYSAFPYQLTDNSRIQSKLSMYYSVYNYIDSIYLYSAVSNTVCVGGSYLVNSGIYNADSFEDNNWLSTLKIGFGNTMVLPRARADYYPYYISLICCDSTTSRNACVININVSRLGASIDTLGGTTQSTYIISDNGILYRKKIQGIPEEMSCVPVLSGLNQFSESGYGLYKQDGQMYAIARVQSRYYDWTYVSVTELQEYNQKITQSQSLILLIMAIIVFTVLGVAFLLSTNIYRPIRSLQKLLDDPQTMQERDIRDVHELAERIVSTVHTNALLQKELDQRLTMLQKLQISALQIQINPHFLFNVLNIINFTIVQDFGPNHRSCEMINKLAKLLRYALDGEENVSLRTELEYTRIYLSIMEKRYIELFTSEFDIEPGIESTVFPKLILQPLLENAIYYGLSPMENIREGHLYIHAVRSGGDVLISISDNGAGMSAERLEAVRERLNTEPMLHSKHIGLRNVNGRLRLMYGQLSGLTIDSVENIGTEVTLRVPFAELN